MNSAEEQIQKTPEGEIELIIDNLIGQIKEIDEYEFFKKVIKAISTSKPEILKNLIAQLSDTEKNSLTQILRTQRVCIHTAGQEIKVPRHIAKATTH